MFEPSVQLFHHRAAVDLMEAQPLFGQHALLPRLIVVAIDLPRLSSTNRHGSGKLGVTSTR